MEIFKSMEAVNDLYGYLLSCEVCEGCMNPRTQEAQHCSDALLNVEKHSDICNRICNAVSQQIDTQELYTAIQPKLLSHPIRVKHAMCSICDKNGLNECSPTQCGITIEKHLVNFFRLDELINTFTVELL